MRRSECRRFFAAVWCAGIGLLPSPITVRADSSILVWGETSWHLDLPTGFTNVVAVSAGGDHAHALSATGQVATWSDGYSSANPSPDLTNATAIAAGYFHSLAIHRGGSVLAWGQNTAGQTNVPSGLDDAVAIAAGFRHSLALRANGTVVAWGANTDGQTDVPAGLTNVVAVSAGAYHSLALLADGRIVGWGDPRAASVPPELTNAVAVSAGTLFSLALTRDGLVRAWGLTGDLHDRVSNTNVPVGLSNVIAVAAGNSHALALREDGTVASWGNRTTTNVPAGLNQVVAIAAGDRYSLGVRTDGPPTITSILPNRSAAFGTTVYLRVEAVGAFPLHYQWRFNGVDLPGATSPVLALAKAQLHQTGAYSVTVSDSFGTTTSPDTRVEILPIAIFSPPESQTTFKGGSALFTVTAASPSPIHHQWLFDGVAMPGATNQTLSLADVQYSQTGRYSVTVSNELGVVSSREALLNVVSVAVWGSTDPNHTRPPADLTNAVSIANGGVFSLALKPDGTVAAWGDSTAGVTGYPTLPNRCDGGSGQLFVLPGPQVRRHGRRLGKQRHW